MVTFQYLFYKQRLCLPILSVLYRKNGGFVARTPIQKCLQAGKNVKLVGFGTFKVTKYSARIGRNPKTGEILKLPAKRFPRFKAGKTLKEFLA